MDKLTKTCSSCGQQKPLTAFLQLSGPEGSTYGNICSSCRRTAVEKNKGPKEKEESTTSTTGFKIDTKSKVQADTDKEQFHKEKEELYHKERDEDETIQLEQEHKVEKIAKQEKAHRQSLFQKSTSLTSNKNDPNDPTQHVFGGEQQTAKEKEVNLKGPFLDTQIPKAKHGTAFRAFLSRLGESSHVARSFLKAAQKEKSLPTVSEKEPLAETAKKLWGPKK
jgi:hypothetical protein